MSEPPVLYIVVLREAYLDVNYTEIYGAYLARDAAEAQRDEETALYEAAVPEGERDFRYWEVQGWVARRQVE